MTEHEAKVLDFSNFVHATMAEQKREGAEKMAYLKRDDILNVNDIIKEEVEVPEWGGVVVIKMLTGKERDEFEASIVNIKSNGKKDVKIEDIRAKLVQKSIIDPESGDLMFEAADIDALSKKSAAALERVFDAAQKLNKFKEEDIEELEKN